MPGKAPIEPKKGNNFSDGSHNIRPTENPYRKKERVGMGIYTQGWGSGTKEDTTPIEQRYEFVSAAKIDANPER